MGLIGALPYAPLRHTDVDEIRGRADVEAFIVTGTTSIRARHGADPVTEAVALVDGTVFALEFHDDGWSHEILRRDADRRAHLEATLEWLSG